MLRAVFSSLIVLLCSHFIVPNSGQAALYFPPMELRPLPIDQPSPVSNFQHGTNLPITTFQSQIPVKQVTSTSISDGKKFISPSLHFTDSVNSVFEPTSDAKHQNSNFNDVQDFMTALDIPDNPVDTDHDTRTAENYEFPHYITPLHARYRHDRRHDYSPPHGYWENPYDHNDNSYAIQSLLPNYYPYHSYQPLLPVPLSSKPVIPKPLLPILPKPVPVKPLIPSLTTLDLSSKLPQLLSVVQSLLGPSVSSGGSTTLATTLRTVLTQLLGSGSSIKILLGKLLLPIIVLVLVNLEVLALTWWLWEDCSQVAPTAAVAAGNKPPSQPDFHYYRKAANAAPLLQTP